MARQMARRVVGVGAAVLVLLAGCSREAPTPASRTPPSTTSQSGYSAPTRQAPQPRAESAVRGNTPEGAKLAEWVLSADPERKYLLDAFVRDDHVLGVVVNPAMTKGQVQQALQSLLGGLRNAFPDRPLDVIAYYRNGDELGRISFDPRTARATTRWRH